MDKKWRIYRRKAAVASLPSDLSARFARLVRYELEPAWNHSGPPAPDPEGLAESLLLRRYAPPAVLLDAEGHILRLSGETAPYLVLPEGAPTLSIHKLAHKSLRPRLRTTMVESGRLSLKVAPCAPFDLRAAVLDLFNLPARTKGLRLTVTIDPELPGTILADEARLRQILFNLVGNAVKFTDKGLVSVTLGPASRHHDTGAHLLISVCDSGIGIPDAQLEAIFEPFSQVEGTYVRRFGGAGLGLSIVRRLTRLMGVS